MLCVQHVLLRYYLRTKPVDHRPVALVMVGVRTRSPASAAATVPKGYGSVPRLAVNWRGSKKESLNLSEIVVLPPFFFFGEVGGGGKSLFTALLVTRSVFSDLYTTTRKKDWGKGAIKAWRGCRGREGVCRLNSQK